jgi:chromosome segregation protein
MLKALELVGFKSFADKTRFEFPAGITVIVGPNGSGKSNIVDAIKWVLGEQSAKSLRGKEMSDVIFKGTGQGGRKVMNTAEATIIFDNSDARLAVDAPEVHITRRVYRSGEGEYLINGQACRLKDIRDLFRGTGVGTDAYSLIEQGKVDSLLQASPRDRRAIFEEAAGISRFKVKKIEAQRRLERVDQNLLRLSDIVEEVGSRLRNVRAQAAKASRYRQYTERLQQLRTQVALTDWRALTERLGEAEAELGRLGDQIARGSTEITAAEARALEWETESECLVEAVREREHRLARNRERITARESAIAHERQHVEEVEAESARYRGQLALLTGRAGDVTHRVQEARTQLAEAEDDHRLLAQRLVEQDRAAADCLAAVDALRGQIESHRRQHLCDVRLAAELTNRITRHETRRQRAEEVISRCDRRSKQLELERAEQTRCRDEIRVVEERLERELADIACHLESAERECGDMQRLLSRRRDELAQQQGRLSGVRERAALLDEWERRNEGLTAGVQQVLARARRDQPGPFQAVLGLVADLIEVPMQWAPLVDAALGGAAQYVVLADRRVLDSLDAAEFRPAGRVGFLTLPDAQNTPALDRVAIAHLPGVLGRLDQLVHASSEIMPVVRCLLGRAWAVEMLAHARQIRASGVRDVRLVTLAGEVLETDGTVVTGPKEVTGLISRRTELRDLRREEAVLSEQLAAGETEIARLRDNIEEQLVGIRRTGDRHKELSGQLADQHVAERTLQHQLAKLQPEIEALCEERQAAQHALDTLAGEQDQTGQGLSAIEARAAELETAIGQREAQLADAERELRQCQRAATATRVDLAKREQRLDGLRRQLNQFEADRRERERALADVQGEIAGAARRRREAQRAILAATSDAALLYLAKDSLAAEITRLNQQHRLLVAQRAELGEQLKSKQRQVAQLREKLHQCELAAGEVRHERNTLADRLREDYGLDIARLDEEHDEEQQQQCEAIEQEIAALKRKISNIGAVNMEALNELDDLEARFASLDGQFQDLTQAKQALERIIHKINTDSRRLFGETLEAIRDNFQHLYRRAFGGGKADLILEEGLDLLECGIDILATPPGKPSFNNSLLSGGEKALTAVALLLAIFQYRPSPFCVLDEVDAPFDEANISRFIEVLKEFLGWTKFVLVTHSKKTMTAATTLYGVTMQESGVSKQVSVRFEDVSEDGQISDEAVRRSREAAAAADDERAA